MKPPPFSYHRPDSVDEACRLLASLDNAKLLAGGQSLMAMLNLRFVYPDHLIDINRIAGLDEIAIGDGKLRVGAMTRQRAMEVHGGLLAAAPIFAEALAVVGHRQTRNRGTLGGSLCHLDPAAELPLLALVHDATVHTVSAGGKRRTLPIDAFIAGFMSPGIEPDEIVVGAEFPLWPAGHGFSFQERARRHGDFAIASVACLMTLEAGRVARVAIGVGGVGSVPLRLPAAEAALLGSACEESAVARAAASCADLAALDDFHGKAAYRCSIAAALLRRAVAAAHARCGIRAAA